MRRVQALTPAELRALRRLLGRRVREARIRVGLSRGGLARAVGLTNTVVLKIEKGILSPPVEFLAALARARGVSLGWFARPAPPG